MPRNKKNLVLSTRTHYILGSLSNKTGNINVTNLFKINGTFTGQNSNKVLQFTWK